MRRGERRVVEQDAAQVFGERLAEAFGGGARMSDERPEIGLRVVQGELFQYGRLTGRIAPDQRERAQVRDQNQAVPFPAADDVVPRQFATEVMAWLGAAVTGGVNTATDSGTVDVSCPTATPSCSAAALPRVAGWLP